MAANSSSSSLRFIYHCTTSTAVVPLSMAFIFIHVIVILPLSLLVLCLGFQRWRQQRSFATTSHSDIFTYHFTAMELIFVLGIVLYSCGDYFGLTEMIFVGFIAMSVVLPGQTPFHVLTCIERYLAVVRPVTYLGLRQSGGVRIRNISIGCVWLLYCGWIVVETLYSPSIPYIHILFMMVLFLAVVSFCSLSVLCVLIRPGPGEMAGNRGWVDQSKQRAFYTILAITVVLWMYFLWLPVSLALDNSNLLTYNDSCMVLVSASLSGLPSNLVLPLQSLHRAGKLLSCHCNSEKRPSPQV